MIIFKSILMCIGVFLHIHLCIPMHACRPRRPEEGTRWYEQPYGCRELNPGPQQEQPTPLTSVISPGPCDHLLKETLELSSVGGKRREGSIITSLHGEASPQQLALVGKLGSQQRNYPIGCLFMTLISVCLRLAEVQKSIIG